MVLADPSNKQLGRCICFHCWTQGCQHTYPGYLHGTNDAMVFQSCCARITGTMRVLTGMCEIIDCRYTSTIALSMLDIICRAACISIWVNLFSRMFKRGSSVGKLRPILHATEKVTILEYMGVRGTLKTTFQHEVPKHMTKQYPHATATKTVFRLFSCSLLSAAGSFMPKASI